MDEDWESSVIVGPELTATRPDTDEKQYRLVTLKSNGLECLLVSDLKSSSQFHSDDEESEEEEVEGEEEEEEEDVEEDGIGQEIDTKQAQVSEEGDGESAAGEEREDSGRLRRAAVCLCTGVGSFMDPPDCQGLAHFLEHMLFMGSAKYPKENEFDEFISKNGGDSNAYTEGEHTSFYFTAKSVALEKALDIFAQFFVEPLMCKDSVERELNAIESEFQLSRSSDSNRLQEVYCQTSIDTHPLSKFGWGNLKTLHGEKPFAALRPFYDQYYVAENMKMCICAPLPLDELQKIFVRTCSAIRRKPQGQDDFKFEPISLKKHGFPFRGPSRATIDAMASRNGVGRGFSDLLLAEKVSLSCAFYVVPIMDVHRLRITFQLPPQLCYYKSKPADYLSHLLGHESEGSILSIAKARGWATSLLAGGDDGGYEQNTACTLFPIILTLTKKGMCEWKQVTQLVLEYISMLRALGPQKWIYEELAAIAKLDYQFLEDGDPEDTVLDHAMNLLPQRFVERKDLLCGPFLLQEWNPALITQLLQHFTLDNMRVDLVSSLFGRDRDYSSPPTPSTPASPSFSSNTPSDADTSKTTTPQSPAMPHLSCSTGHHDHNSDEDSDSEGEEEEDEEIDDSASEGQSEGDEEPEDEEEAKRYAAEFPNNPALGVDREEPLVEPHFKTRYWIEQIDSATLHQWQEVIDTTFTHVRESDGGDTASGLRLPRANPYIASDLELKPFPAEHAVHPLVGAFVRAKVKRGRRTEKLHGFVLNFNAKTRCITTAFEDDIMEEYTTFMLSEQDADPLRWNAGCSSFTAKQVAARKRVKGNDGLPLSGLEIPIEVLGGGFSSHCPQQLGHAAMRLFDLRDALSESDGKTKGKHSKAKTKTSSSSVQMTANRMPPLAECYMPHKAQCSTPFFELWALHNRVFRTPKTAVYLNIICGAENEAIRTLPNAVASDLFISMVSDSLTDEAYLASMAELEYEIRKSEAGLRLRFFGFSDKLFRLVDIVLEHFLFKSLVISERTRRRFAMHRESLLRSYRNSGTKSQKYATNLRLRALKPTHYGATDMLAALEGGVMGSLEELVEFVQDELLSTIMIDGLICGNIDVESEPVQLHKLVCSQFKRLKATELTRNQFPQHEVLNLEPGTLSIVAETGKDPNDKNNSLELYIQIGPDNLADRVVLDLIEHLMEEPIYDQLRTKKQLGYSVSCGVRITNKILGYVIRATSATHSPEQLQSHAFAFLVDFLEQLDKLSAKEFDESVFTLVEVKLEDDNNLGEETKRHWSAISDHSFFWHECKHEAFALFGVSKAMVLARYKEWLLPTTPTTRMLSVQVKGANAKVSEVESCPETPIPHAVNVYVAEDLQVLHHPNTKAKHYSTASL